MLKTIKGTYKNGTIKLSEIPENIRESQVLVTFIETSISENVTISNSTEELFKPLRGKIQYFEDLTTPTTEEWGEI
jgi:hypothetical protein